jgi:hypothetical protein
MPTTKLTLSADTELIRQAKQLARKRGTSLSAMFDRFVRSVVLHEALREAPGPLTAQALGLVDLPEDRTDSELLEEALAERHQS